MFSDIVYGDILLSPYSFTLSVGGYQIKKLTQDQFIQRSILKHNGKYDYSLVEYLNLSTKIKIICPIHGVFEQIPKNHVNGFGCPKCSGKEKHTSISIIKRFIKKHGDKYDYSIVDYKNNKSKVKIICPIHGVFEQSPTHHINGQGCPKCANIKNSNISRLTIDSFIIRSKEIHNDFYCYSKSIYVNSHTKITIICPDHGEFEQVPYDHLSGHGCSKCSSIISKQELGLQEWIKSLFMSKKLTQEEFVNRSIDVHSNRYDYTQSEYINAKTKVKIICPEHGVFEQLPRAHFDGQGCPECGKLRTISKLTTSTTVFIDNAVSVHGDKYDYSFVKYKQSHSKIKIICPEHGVFEQTPTSHLSGCACPKCGINTTKTKLISNTDEFIKISTKVHGDKYDYSLVIYTNNKTKVKIICPEHGVFEQRPDNHVYLLHGCPKCSSIISKQELGLQEWIKGNVDILTNDRSIISPYELDIVIPSHKIAIEYNGLYWHSETQGKNSNYHLNKYNMCKDKGYRLIQIWENEWLTKQDIVKSIIKSSLGLHTIKIHGRKCDIKIISPKEARPFYNNNHIQGFHSGEHHGLYYNDELVSCLTIKKYNTGDMLERFVNKTNVLVHGSFTKLLKSFNITSDLITFSDPRYFMGNVYESNGFEYMYNSKPNYFYFKNGSLDVYNRRNFQKKNIQRKYETGYLDTFDLNKTEYQNMLDNGYHRIWDCGNMKYILSP